MLNPGTVLSLRSAPEIGLWTVVSCARSDDDETDVVLLGRVTLLHVSSSRESFDDRWDVVHEP